MSTAVERAPNPVRAAGLRPLAAAIVAGEHGDEDDWPTLGPRPTTTVPAPAATPPPAPTVAVPQPAAARVDDATPTPAGKSPAARPSGRTRAVKADAPAVRAAAGAGVHTTVTLPQAAADWILAERARTGRSAGEVIKTAIEAQYPRLEALFADCRPVASDAGFTTLHRPRRATAGDAPRRGFDLYLSSIDLQRIDDIATSVHAASRSEFITRVLLAEAVPQHPGRDRSPKRGD